MDSQVCLCEGVAGITWVESNGGSGPLIEEGRPMWCEDTAMQCNVRPCKACCRRTNSCTEPGRRLVTKATKATKQLSSPPSSARSGPRLPVAIVTDARHGGAG